MTLMVKPQLGSGAGPIGYSACMVNAVQNRDAGFIVLNGFYGSNRVIERDPFRVWIQ